MLRTAFISLLFLVSVSSSSMLRKSVVRRQNDAQYCQAIEGFECKCSYYRVTCTTDRDLPSTIQVSPNEKQKYQSVELVIGAPANLQVTDRTFEQIKELYKPDGDNLEFRVKFEKFAGLHLSSPGLFNRVFPDNLQSNARKHLAVDIYTPDVPPTNNPNLFQGLNVDSLELFGLYPFHGTFQSLFNGANIKFLRLSGGDISSDLSQPFTGNVGRVELAKQASSLSVQNFPVYPTHELVINAFYVSDFNSENPPNYSNLKELRVFSTENIPAGAFRQFPNLQTLSVATEKDIDPNAFSGLTNLEKLTIKDTKPSLNLLNSVPTVKEFEANIDKLDDNAQCQLLEKLANGQIAVQAVPNGEHCTCANAYLSAAAGRAPCDAQHCEHSTCAAIKNSYDASTRTFKAPPAIRRSDGSDALRQRDARVYSAPFQVSQQDQDKLQRGAVQQVPQQQYQPQQPGDDSQRPNEGETDQGYNPSVDREDQEGETNTEKEEGENTQDEQGTNQEQGENVNPEYQGVAGNGTETGEGSLPPKKGMSWLPIIIIAASIVGLLLIGLVILLLRKKRANQGYATTATKEPTTGTTTRA